MIRPQEPGLTGTLLRILPGLIISLVAVIVLVTVIDPATFWAALREVNLAYLVVYLIISLAWLAVRAQLWRTLLTTSLAESQAAQVNYWDIFLTINTGYLLNNILPLRMGEVGRAYLMSRKSSLPFWRIAPSVVIERLLDITFAAGCFLLTLPAAMIVIRAQAEPIQSESMQTAAQTAILIGIVMLIGLIGIHLVARYRQAVNRLLERFTPAALATRIQPLYTNLLEGMAAIANFSGFMRVLAWVVLNWGIAILQFTAIILAFFPPENPFSGTLLQSSFTVGTFSLGIAIPSTPASIGVFEAAFSTPLILLGAEQSTAVACAVLAHAIQFIITGTFGAYALSREGQSFADLASTLFRLRSANSAAPASQEEKAPPAG
jgi:uncharacterized protein (TIRG00374 family)